MPSSDLLIIIDNDIVMFDPSSFLPVTFIPPVPTTVIKASGNAEANKDKICLVGDEKKVKLNWAYMTASHPIPGAGVLEIIQLDSSQQASNTKHNKKKIITKGKQFKAKFTVNTPAQVLTPSGPQPSPTMSYQGKGMFPSPKNLNVFAK